MSYQLFINATVSLRFFFICFSHFHSLSRIYYSCLNDFYTLWVGKQTRSDRVEAPEFEMNGFATWKKYLKLYSRSKWLLIIKINSCWFGRKMTVRVRGNVLLFASEMCPKIGLKCSVWEVRFSQIVKKLRSKKWIKFTRRNIKFGMNSNLMCIAISLNWTASEIFLLNVSDSFIAVHHTVIILVSTMPLVMKIEMNKASIEFHSRLHWIFKLVLIFLLLTFTIALHELSVLRDRNVEQLHLYNLHFPQCTSHSFIHSYENYIHFKSYENKEHFKFQKLLY